MRRTIALLLVILIVFSLTACKETPPASEPVDSVPPTSTAPTQTPPPAQVQAPDATGTVGYLTDDVEHFARDTYDFVYVFSNPSNLTMYMTECFETLGERLNYKLTTATANGDANLYVNNIIPAVLIKEPDGLIIDMPFEYQDRLREILDEAGVPYISLFNSVTDENGYEIVPVVMMNHYLNGQKQVELMEESRTKYWGEIDTSKLGLIALTFSLNADLTTRGRGAVDKFKELYPNNYIFEADAATVGYITGQTGYDLTSSAISANPDVEYWFVASCVEDMSIGAARATEALGKTDCVLITGSGASVLPGEWDAGYEGNWIGNFAVSNYQYAVPAACGLIALCDGRATPETLWEDLKRPGDKAAQFVVGTDTITRDTYKDFFRIIEEGFGIYK